MFNLPWYVWFNVLAVPLVWAVVWFGLKCEKASPWKFTASTTGHVSAVLVIFLYWNEHIQQVTAPLSYFIAAAALATFLYCGVSTIAEGIRLVFRNFKIKRQMALEDTSAMPSEASIKSQSPNKLPEYVDGIFDIDDDCGDFDSEKIGENIDAIFSPDKSFADAPFFQEMGSDYTDDELREDGNLLLFSYCLVALPALLVMGAPGWMGFQLLKAALPPL